MAPKAHFPILRIEHFEGCDGLIIKDVAHILRRSYETVQGAIHRLGIRDRFPARGGAAVQLSIRGYNQLYLKDCKENTDGNSGI